MSSSPASSLMSSLVPVRTGVGSRGLSPINPPLHPNTVFMLGQFSSIAHSDQRYCATATISIDEGGGASRGVLVVVPKVGVSAAIGGADGVSSTAVSGGDNLVTVLALTLYANALESTPQSKFISRVRGRNGQSLRPERSYPCCLGNSDIAIPPTSRLLLQSESPFEGLVTKEEEKRGVAAVPGGVIAS